MVQRYKKFIGMELLLAVLTPSHPASSLRRLERNF